MIQKEIKTKKYLIKNDFDVLKGFREFLHELNKSLIFKLSKKYEQCDYSFLVDILAIMRKKILNHTEIMWLRKILIKIYINDYGEDIRYLELDDMIDKILDFSGSKWLVFPSNL